MILIIKQTVILVASAKIKSNFYIVLPKPPNLVLKLHIPVCRCKLSYSLWQLKLVKDKKIWAKKHKKDSLHMKVNKKYDKNMLLKLPDFITVPPKNPKSAPSVTLRLITVYFPVFRCAVSFMTLKNTFSDFVTVPPNPKMSFPRYSLPVCALRKQKILSF